ncbi:MAG: histone deacetylase [Planctomycetota bacterium]
MSRGKAAEVHVPVVYHPDYYANIGSHVFPTRKFSLVFDAIQRIVGNIESSVHRPSPATREQLLRVHAPEYLADLDACRWTPRTAYSELPLTKEIVDAYYLMAGGTCLAANLACEYGGTMNLGGGFHHAFADRAEGFCYVNDIAVAVREIQAQRLVERVAVIDTDLHQGNGTARIFRDDPQVFTFSIHQEDLYPVKEQSSLDIGLEDGTEDHEYFTKLRQGLDVVFGQFNPQFVMYVGGVDPYKEDRLGSLQLTKVGIKQRDTMVFRRCRDHGVPVAAVLAGGYAADVGDTVEMHANTYLALRDALS